MSRKIAICGTAEPHWRSAPYADESWEIWTCGGIFSAVPRVTRHFEIHDKAETCKGWGQSPEEEAASRSVYWQWIAEQGPNVYLKERLPETPNASVYPLQDVLTAFPDAYFTNSISYMIALALMEGCDEIGLWGIDMALTGDLREPASNEYSLQRPSVEFYLGIACGRGIRVHLPPETTLLKARKLYGFDGPSDDNFNRVMRAKIEELENRQRQIQAARRQIERDETGVAWALEVAGYAQRNLEY